MPVHGNSIISHKFQFSNAMTSLQNLASYPTLQAEWEALKLITPISFLCLLNSGASSVTLVYAGRIGSQVLDGVGLASTISSTVVFAFAVGYANVFDTYGPQVYGSKHKKDLSTVTLKCILQGLILYLMTLGPYLLSVYIIDALPNDDDSKGDASAFKDVAKEYLRMTCICGYIYYLIKILGNYLAIQKQTKFVYAIAAISFSSHLLFNYILVGILSWETSGLALAVLGSNLTTLAVVLMICFVMIKKGTLLWGGIHEGLFSNWLPMIKLGLSGVVSTMAEIGLFQLAVFLSKFDGAIVLSTFLIQFRLISIAFTPNLGIAYSAAVLIGKALSRGDLNKVKLHMKLAILNVIIESLVLIIIIYLVRKPFMMLFTADEDVIKMGCDTMWWLCLQLPFDHLQVVLAKGILVPFGKQRYIAVTSSIVAYCVCVPVVAMAVFLTDLKIAGLYICYLSYGILQSLTTGYRIWKLDLRNEVHKASIRITESTFDRNQYSEDGTGTVNLAYKAKDEEVVENGGTNTGTDNLEEERTENILQPSSSRDKKIILMTLIAATVSCAVLGLISVIKT